ncbi:hypothetical protein [Azomonas macrocytogenes]|uniref:Uncharacterized protein n=1 Tax=Azomonas macrocytogenes TaxID=69962 RepID=A0A839T685_AZOMA|nr:hypothetical protein [Azomonas macrocytogenes]MBB3103804.1 hypothetical protein [Azomonas macrocytogenes]
MAVLVGQHVRPTRGGIDNPHLTIAHDSFVWINQFDPAPFVSDTQRAGQAGLIAHWPVEANGRVIAAQRVGCFGDDWYYRIHLSPQALDLGNVVSTQTTPAYAWNAWLEPRTLNAITGVDEGIELTGQPSPPLLFAALQEREWQVSVTPDGPAVLDTALAWVFDNGESPAIEITATRIIAWAFVPDWSNGVLERLSWLTDVLQSESFVEQRRALRIAPRREFEGAMYAEGRERQLLDLALFSWGARIWALPMWPDIQLLDTPVALGALRIDCKTEHLDFAVGGLAMLRGESAFSVEVVEVAGIDASGLDLARGTSQAWPSGTRLYPARTAQLTEQPSLTRLTDRLYSTDVHFLLMDPSDLAEVLPATIYRGQPVFEQRPDESEDLTASYQRLLLTLDNSTAMPLVTDTANRAMPVQGWRWLDLGRAERAAYRSLLYALRGRQVPIWLPTHADDLTLVAPVTEVATTLNVANCGYARFGQARPGRRDIRIELWDGTVFHRRITGAAEQTADMERLALNAALGRSVTPDEVMRISWLVLCRLDDDTVEIQHMTDSEGVASSSLVFRGVRDDEF